MPILVRCARPDLGLFERPYLRLRHEVTKATNHPVSKCCRDHHPLTTNVRPFHVEFPNARCLVAQWRVQDEPDFVDRFPDGEPELLRVQRLDAFSLERRIVRGPGVWKATSNQLRVGLRECNVDLDPRSADRHYSVDRHSSE